MRMKEILNEAPKTEVSGQLPYKKTWQKLHFEKVSFSYGGHKVFKGLNFTLKRGEKLGIVGLSGAGKSTLFKLLLKLYDTYEGTIRFDQVSLHDIKRSSLVKAIAYVPQETELFNFSLKDNIALASFGRLDKKALSRSLKVAHINDFLHKLPENVDTLVGEKGVKLSGGEKQRVGIARAIYKKPDLLFMDEATSHLDAESESKIQEALHDVFSEVTAIVVAHRLSTLKEMDRIIVMKNGQIIEEGTFKSLIAKQGEFYKLWQKQKF